MSPTKPLWSVRATAEPPCHHPRSISLTDADILGMNHVDPLLIAPQQLCALHVVLCISAIGLPGKCKACAAPICLA
eukprot:scaffold13170_cov184-Skeletonema_marinoi.AAC.5